MGRGPSLGGDQVNQVQDKTDSKKASFEDDICHLYCTDCWPDPANVGVALCGTDLSGHEYKPNAPLESVCAMCAEILEEPCFKCGGYN